MMPNKESGTARGVLRNVMFGFTTWLLPLTLGVIATPVIVRGLGNEDYGIYALVLGFVGYSFNLNIGRAITKYIAEYKANNKPDEINSVISTTVVLNLLVGVIGAVTIILIAPWLVESVFVIAPASREKAVLALYLASLIVFVTMFSQVFTSVLQGLQRFDTYAKIFNFNSIGLVSGNLVLALLGYGLNALLAWNLGISVVTFFLGGFVCYRLMPEFRPVRRIERVYIQRVLGFSIGVIGYQILSNALLLFERGWITRNLGSATLTYYVVPMMLGIYLHSFISSLLMVVFPLASELRDEKDRLKRLYLKATKAVSVPAVFLATSLIVQSHYFLTLWMGADFADKTWLLLVLHTITFGLLALQVVSWQMTEGLGHTGYNFFVFSICFVVVIGLMIYSTGEYGAVGIAVSRLTGFALIFVSVFIVERWKFGSVQIAFWLRSGSFLLAAAAATAFVEYFTARAFGTNWPGFLAAGTFGVITFAVVLYVTGFVTKEEKSWILGLIRR